mgnify:CR=1 FL=1
MRKLIVNKKYDGKYLNRFILDSFPNLSSNQLYKALRKKAILTKEDVEWLLCGDDEFLPKHAKGLNFPNFVPRFRGFRTWAVYEWIDKFQIRSKHK